MVALGILTSRNCQKIADNRQLIIVLSVPVRDFAATLIGCGWVLASTAPKLPPPLATLKEVVPGEPLRVVNSHHVITGTFSFLDETVSPPQMQFAGSRWRLDRIRAVAHLDALETPVREPRPEASVLERLSGPDSWDAKLAHPNSDLAIVGTLAWLERDLDGYLTIEGDDSSPSSIKSLLRPKSRETATWFSQIFSSARFGDRLPLSNEFQAVILDGNGAIKFLGEIDAPVVICVLDRSVSDETAAEMVIQLRNTRGEPLSPAADLGWHGPKGVESLAFTVAL